ncbi:MFS transporter, partial [Burkholderia aenigmatica]|uniref:MFS transporter n=1 Tax=Burkholderia aenigmatica TaxID=2015348 RepID=UPI003CC83756
MLEWFDYSLYGYLSATLAKVFFPSSDPIVSLIAAFAAFSVAFVTRPLGALFFGSLGDRLGRRDTLAIVVGLIVSAHCRRTFVAMNARASWCPLQRIGGHHARGQQTEGAPGSRV